MKNISKNKENFSRTRPSQEAGAHHLIAEKAYELYSKRGCTHGQDLEDWFEAERVILEKYKPQMNPKPKAPYKGNLDRQSGDIQQSGFT